MRKERKGETFFFELKFVSVSLKCQKGENFKF